MSLKFGLNIKSKTAAPTRRVAFDDDDDFDDAPQAGPAEAAVEDITSFGGPPPLRPQPRPVADTKVKNAVKQSAPESRENRSATAAADRSIKAAEELDPSIFDYDSFYDAKAAVGEAKKAAARQDAIERKPKYINNLLDAANRRKQDQQIAREKLLQREREAEGDEFADKEKFVTGAYKLQQEETRRLEEEEERRKAEEDAKRKDKLGGGMQSLYRNMMEQTERQHQEAMEAATKADRSTKTEEANRKDHEMTDAQIAAEARAKGIKVHTNEDGQITDKRELLSAGLNVGTSGQSSDRHAADHLRSANQKAPSAFPSRDPANQKAQRERQSRMLEEQLAAQAKRAREEEDEERQRLEKAAKSTKTEKDVSDAKARYLARKAAKERGEG